MEYNPNRVKLVISPRKHKECCSSDKKEIYWRPVELKEIKKFIDENNLTPHIHTIAETIGYHIGDGSSTMKAKICLNLDGSKDYFILLEDT